MHHHHAHHISVQYHHNDSSSIMTCSNTTQSFHTLLYSLYQGVKPFFFTIFFAGRSSSNLKPRITCCSAVPTEKYLHHNSIGQLPKLFFLLCFVCYPNFSRFLVVFPAWWKRGVELVVFGCQMNLIYTWQAALHMKRMTYFLARKIWWRIFWSSNYNQSS